MGKII
jgi:hypothetical protein